MGRSKKTFKPKEPIKLRSRILTNGNRSLYLDKYVKGKRTYEYLNLYLIPEIDNASKLINEQTLKAANVIKAQRLLEYINDVSGIKKNIVKSGNITLLDWIQIVRDKKLKHGYSKGRAYNYDCAIKHIKTYIGDKHIKISDVDKDFIIGFIDYLSNARIPHRTKDTQLSKTTALLYYKVFRTCMKEAVRCGYIDKDFTLLVNAEEKKNITPVPPDRGYLTINEVKMFQRAKTKTEIQKDVKRAFLFSCFTGLRISDIRTLTWDNIRAVENSVEIVKRMEKTQRIVHIPLSKEAIKYLPSQKNCHEDNIFILPSIPSTICRSIRSICKTAGIKKHISFHTARHTFATLGLTSGVDIYTISKLLGHTKITTTQIYTDVINQKKVDAVNLIGENFRDV